MVRVADLPEESYKEVTFACISAEQPVGSIYIGVIPWSTLRIITYFDVRGIVDEGRAVDTYLGIQRPLKPDRVTELKSYVNLKDASFPTGIIIAVEADCASYDSEKKLMTLSNKMEAEDPGDRIFLRNIARVIDGQHRIAGLEGFTGEIFDLPVIILVGMDIADQGHLFATVNLAQTKVSPSLAYDLYDLAKSRSPQKTCHNIAVAFDQHEKSPFHKKIKRLGVRTSGRFNETLTQATFVRALIRYLSDDPMGDRDQMMRGLKLQEAQSDVLDRLIFRNMFIKAEDLRIMDVVWNFFEAVRERWPDRWANSGRGNVLIRTSGFRSFMRFLRPAYLNLGSPGDVPTKDNFLQLMRRISLQDNDFDVERYKPGSSGEASLYADLISQSGLDDH